MSSSTATYSLRPPQVADEVDSNLSLLVARIIQERGHFKNVTEESLEAEIAEQAKDDASDAELDEGEDKPQTIEARRAELGAARLDLVTQLGRAQNDIGMALDFVSLLLSRERPEKASVSMSPFIKDLLKDNMGSLAFDFFEPAERTQAEKKAETKVALGWNLKRLGESADSLLKSATSLESEMKKEAQYWDDVLSISERGWSVCRVGKGSTIGVRYGFRDAAPQFSAQGLAALRPGAEGRVKLDQGLRRTPKSIRIQIKDGDRTVSKSRVRASESEQAPVEAMIQQARDSLFEEELHSELSREARSLLSLGVTVEDGTIVAPITAPGSKQRKGDQRLPRRILIDLVPRSSDVLDITDEDPSADSIATSLRILMMNVYHQKFRRRSKPPAPLSKEKPPPPIYQLLRPVLGYTLHQAATTKVRGQVGTLVTALKRAGIATSLQLVQNAPGPRSLLELATRTKGKLQRADDLVASLCEPLSTSLKMTVNQEHISVDIATHLAPPYYGTQYRVIKSSQPGSGSSPSAVFDDSDALQDHVSLLIRQSVAVDTLPKLPGWQLEYGSATLSRTIAQPANKRRRRTVHVAVSDGVLALVGGDSEGAGPKVWGAWSGESPAGDEKAWSQAVEEAAKAA